MVYNSDVDEAMDDIKKAMHLLRLNTDPDSVLFWEALLEVNRAFAMEDTEKAIRSLKNLSEAPVLSGRSEFSEVYSHITHAYTRMNQSCRNPDDAQSLVQTVKKYTAVP